MSSAFVHAPTFEAGGSTVDAWLKHYWDSAVFAGDDLIAIHDGSRHPTKECAVVYRNFRPVTGTPGAYFADPVAIVQYRSGMAKGGRDPVLLGFKNVWLSVDYTAPPPPPPAPERRAPSTPATSGGRSWASIAAEPVLPTAGLARLRALAGEC